MPSLHTAAFLFTDIEGSAHLWEEAPEAMRAALERHDGILRSAVGSHDGVVFKTTGDGLHAIFPSCQQAVKAAVAGLRGLIDSLWPAETGPLHVRMGIHWGEVQPRDGDYFGGTLNRTARIMAAAHGGQILVSAEVAEQVAAAALTDIGLRNMGTHRMKGLAQLEHLYQVVVSGLPADFPRPNTLDVTPNNLPVQLTSFIGREAELQAVETLLHDHRLVTLTGPGGCGKTRLALKAAETVQGDYSHGVWLAELAPLSDPALLPQTVAQALGLRLETDRPLAAALADYLRPRSLLLVLDNCEHLVDACAQLVEALLHACPNLHILASSRESFNVPGEMCFVVPSMATPDPRRLPRLEILGEIEAVRLFVERAAAVQPAFTLTEQNAPAVARICQRLDGIPLALELAAARVKVMTAEQIAARLDDRFHLLTGGSRTALPRQQTLRALIDWSYDLLSEPEQTLFRRLSTFASGCTLDAAESVCAGGDVAADDVLALLTSLTDKSLVFVEETGGEASFQRLETIRQYALEKFQRTGEVEAVRDRHLDFFVALAERAEPKLTGPAQQVWMARLERELDNIRAALAWAAERDPLSGVRIVGALRWFWDAHETYRDACNWLTGVLEREDAALPPHARARALSMLAFLSIARYDMIRSEALAEEAVRACRAVGDRRGLALSLLAQGIAANTEGRRAASEAMLLECLDLYRALDDRAGQVDVLISLGVNVVGHRNYTQARGYLETALALCRELGHLAATAQCLQGLGSLALRNGDLALAAQRLDEGLAALRMITMQDISSTDELLGELAYWQGNYAAARTHFETSLRLSEELGHQLTATWATVRLGYVEMQQGNLQAARAVLQQSLHEFNNRNIPVGVVFAVEGLASLALIGGKPARAAQLLAWSDAARAEIDDLRPPMEQEVLNRKLADIRWQLGRAGFETALAAGRTLTTAQAISLACGDSQSDS